MISQSQPSPEMSYYDPLASHFMTGGQMGYMPHAQFMTDPRYGAFRTMPGPQMTPTTMQTPTLWQSYLTANRGKFFGMGPAYTFSTYNPAADQLAMLTMAQRKTADALSAIKAPFMDWAAAGLAGSVVGAVNPLAGMAVGLAMPSITSPYLDRIRQGRQIQNLSMSKIVGGPDMSAALGQGFSGASSMRIGEHLRELSSKNVIFNNEDMRNIMQLGIEHGQFDYSLNVQQYKNTMGKLTKNMKAFMEILGTSDMRSIFEEMRRLQTMGASLSDMPSIMNRESMFSRMAGIGHSDMVNTYGQQGALLYSQAGLTGYQGSLMNMSNAATNTLMQRLGLYSPGEIARAGGISGLTQNATVTKADLLKKFSKVFLPYASKNDFTKLDSNIAHKLATGNFMIEDIAAKSGDAVRGPGKLSSYNAWKAEGLEQLQNTVGEQGVNSIITHIALKMGEKFGITDPKKALMYVFQVEGADPETARQLAESMTNKNVISGQITQAENQKTRMLFNDREEFLNENGIYNRALLALRKDFQRYAGSTYGELSSYFTEQKDRYEDNRAGISKVYKGKTSGFGSSSFEKEIIDKVTNKARNTQFQFSDKLKAVGYLERFKYGDKGAVERYSFLGELVGASKMHATDLESGMQELADYGLSTDALKYKIIERLKDKKSITENDVLMTLKDALMSSGIPGKDVVKIADKIWSSPRSKKAFLNLVGTDESMLKTMNWSENSLADYKKRLFQTRMDDFGKRRSDWAERIGEMTEQSFWINDSATQNSFIDAMSKDSRGASLGAFLKAAGALYYGKGSNAKRREKIDNLTREFAAKLGFDVKGFKGAQAIFNSSYKDKFSAEQIDSITNFGKIKHASTGSLSKFGEELSSIYTEGLSLSADEKSFDERYGIVDGIYNSNSEYSGKGGKNASAIAKADEEIKLQRKLLDVLEQISENLKTSNRVQPITVPGGG